MQSVQGRSWTCILKRYKVGNHCIHPAVHPVDLLMCCVDLLCGLVDVLCGLVDIMCCVDLLCGLVDVLCGLVDMLCGLVDIMICLCTVLLGFSSNGTSVDGRRINGQV